jgi:hypothetical protein
MSVESIFRQLLTQLHLLSRGPIKAPGLDGKSRDKPDSMIMTGEISPDPVMYVRRWEKAGETRLKVLEDMGQEIDSDRASRKRPQFKHSEDWRREVAKAARSNTVRWVAWRFQCSTKTVVKCKGEFPE